MRNSRQIMDFIFSPHRQSAPPCLVRPITEISSTTLAQTPDDDSIYMDPPVPDKVVEPSCGMAEGMPLSNAFQIYVVLDLGKNIF